MRLEQVPKVQDRRLIGDRVAAEFKMAERAHRLDVVERFLGTRIGQVIPLLQTVDAQHHGDRKWSAAAVRTSFGILNQSSAAHGTTAVISARNMSRFV